LRFAPALLLLATLAAGCGQFGELYLRESPPPGLKPERPAAVKPVPYRRESGEEKGAGETGK